MAATKAFFDAVRSAPFGGKLAQSQVDGMNTIINAWDATHSALDQRWLAYCLASVFHESARTMQPIEEYGHGAGHPYGVPDPTTGKRYFGRGLIQITWIDNYRKMGDLIGIDLVQHPERALEPAVATIILIQGMVGGFFTGRKLADYFNARKDDPVGARKIVNGQDRAVLIAGYHRRFLGALRL